MGNSTRRDGRVEPGQKISRAFSARAWNRAQEAADIVFDDRGRFGGDGQTGSPLAPNIALIRNDSGVVVPWLGVLGISGVVINPSGGTITGTNAASERARRFARRPVLIGTAPDATGFPDTDTSSRVAIAMEPVEPGAIGRFAVGGVFACRIKSSGQSYRYARGRTGDVTQLISTSCGPIRLLWIESGGGNNKLAVGVM